MLSVSLDFGHWDLTPLDSSFVKDLDRIHDNLFVLPLWHLRSLCALSRGEHWVESWWNAMIRLIYVVRGIDSQAFFDLWVMMHIWVLRLWNLRFLVRIAKQIAVMFQSMLLLLPHLSQLLPSRNPVFLWAIEVCHEGLPRVIGLENWQALQGQMQTLTLVCWCSHLVLFRWLYHT